MFNTDKPITNTEDDMLNRDKFSKELARAILQYNDTDNFAISLCGPWGCGKTSILNMVTEHIENFSSIMEDDEKPVIVNFNPWNYADKDQLITEFFKEISCALKKTDKSGRMESVGKAIENYSAIIDYAKFIPVAGKYIKLLKPIIKSAGKGISHRYGAEKSLKEQKNEVIEELSKLNRRIIVIIDDIDRLNNEQIRLIFQLVNSVAGFPNMIYLLSFDKSVVVRALCEEQNCDGAEYLEKIIQVPFDIPVAKKQSIDAVFFGQIEDTGVDLTDKEYFFTVYNNCISHFIKSIRDANRVINAFKLKYALVRGEVNWVDLLCITTLQVSAPEIYNWIADNIADLEGLPSLFGLSTDSQKEKVRGNYLKLFETVYSKNPEMMLKTIQILFPSFCRRTGGDAFCAETIDRLRYMQRIASPNHSKLYFNLLLDDIDIKRSVVINTIKFYSKEQLQAYLMGLEIKNKLSNYIQELYCCINEIPDDRRAMFFDVIIKFQSGYGLIDDSLYATGISINYSQCIWELLNKMEDDEKRDLFIKWIDLSTEKEFAVLSYYIFYIESSYGKFGNEWSDKYKVVTAQTLDLIEERYLEKLRAMFNINLFAVDDMSYIAVMWSHFNKAEYEEYIKNQLKNAVNYPGFLKWKSRFIGTGSDKRWDFRPEDIKNVISLYDLYIGIQSLKRTNSFRNLSEAEKRVAVAYSLWYESNEDVRESMILLTDVNELLPSWIESV